MIIRDTGRPRKDTVGCDNRYDNANTPPPTVPRRCTFGPTRLAGGEREAGGVWPPFRRRWASRSAERAFLTLEHAGAFAV